MIKKEISELKAAILSLRKYFKAATFISFIAGLFSLAPVIYMRVVYGPVIDSGSEINLMWVTLILLFALMIVACLEWVRSQILMAASIMFGDLLSARVFSACFKANLSAIPGGNQGLTHLRQIRIFISSNAMVALLDAPVAIIFLLLIFEIHPTMGVFSLFGAVLSGGLSYWTERKVHPHITEAQKYSSIAQGFMTSGGRNALVVEAMGMHRNIRAIWQEHQNKYLYHQALASNSQAHGTAISKFIMLVQGAAMLGVGTFLTLIGHLPPEAAGALIIAKILGGKAMQPIMQLIMQWKQVALARDAYDDLDKFLKDVPVKYKGMSLPKPLGQLNVEGLALRAPGTNLTVVSGVDFQIPAGACLAIIGPSGSGKTSLVRALVGVWPPLIGRVRLDGADIYQWDKDELGSYLGYLPQDIELFDGSFSQNIARFGDVDEEKLQEAIKLAGLDTVVSSFPLGVDTDIGNDGVVLSGGQRQRVALARALYGNPCLIVLDEPNSNLDADGEKKLIEAVIELKKQKRTVIFITHRLEMTHLSDYILVMQKGSPQLFGRKDAVLEKISQNRVVRND